MNGFSEMGSADVECLSAGGLGYCLTLTHTHTQAGTKLTTYACLITHVEMNMYGKKVTIECTLSHILI